MTSDGNVTLSSWEKRNIGFFIAGIMCFKFAFESLGNSISLFVLTRITDEPITTLSMLLILYGVCQSLGSILVAQLVQIFRPSRVISVFIGIFASLGAVYIAIEAATGGTFTRSGNWNPYLIFPIYMTMGLCLGVMELDKLKKMDATVHVFYEIAGTSGAFMSTVMIQYLGPVYAITPLPPLFLVGSLFYSRIRENHSRVEDGKKGAGDGDSGVDSEDGGMGLADGSGRRTARSCCSAVLGGITNYFKSLGIGAKIVLTQRKFVWMIFGYVIALVLHRGLESLLLPVYAKNVLKDGALSGILLGGVNFGELCGALLVLFFTRLVPTPLPWVRFDAIFLTGLWIFVYMPSFEPLHTALAMVPAMVLVGGSWAAGDVTLLAYIQAQLGEDNVKHEGSGVNTLGAVMGFLYASYVVMATMVSYALGRVMDHYDSVGNVREGFFWVAGVGASAFAVLIFLSTFIPRGSLKFNPKPDALIDGHRTESVGLLANSEPTPKYNTL